MAETQQGCCFCMNCSRVVSVVAASGEIWPPLGNQTFCSKGWDKDAKCYGLIADRDAVKGERVEYIGVEILGVRWYARSSRS